MKESPTLRRYSMEASRQPQVFINFRGSELRYTFVYYLRTALVKNGINVFTDNMEPKGRNQKILFKRIEESKIALAIFSSRYTESSWCLEELVKMKECMDAEKLVIIPIFYIVTPYTIKKQMGDFGDKFRVLVDYVDDVTEKKWTDALKSVPLILGITYDGQRYANLLLLIVHLIKGKQNCPLN